MPENTKIDINGIEVTYISVYNRYYCLGKTFKNLIQVQNYIESSYEELIECKLKKISMDDDMVDYDDDFEPSYDDNLTDDDYDDECDSPNENSEEDD